MATESGLSKLNINDKFSWINRQCESLPINARAVPPGFPQAAWGVQVAYIRGVGQERIDAVKGVCPVQVPPAAGWVWLVVVLVPVLILHPGGGVAERLLHAATVLLCSAERQRGMLPFQVVLVQLAFAVVQETAGLFSDVQVVDLQGRAGRRGAFGLRVQGGGRRRQRALPPDTAPLSNAFSLGQFTKNTPRRRWHNFTVLAVRVRGVAILRHKVALVVNVVIDAGVCPKSLRGFPNVHPQGIGRSLLLRLDPSGPRIHWRRVYR